MRHGRMTVGELREALEGLEDDVEVRLAMQPRWAFEYTVERVAAVEVADRNDNSEEEPPKRMTVYLAEGRQIGYLPGVVAEELGW